MIVPHSACFNCHNKIVYVTMFIKNKCMPNINNIYHNQSPPQTHSQFLIQYASLCYSRMCTTSQGTHMGAGYRSDLASNCPLLNFLKSSWCSFNLCMDICKASVWPLCSNFSNSSHAFQWLKNPHIIICRTPKEHLYQVWFSLIW